jgi:hypothetical protein
MLASAFATIATFLCCTLQSAADGAIADSDGVRNSLDRAYSAEIRPLVAQFCHKCHGSDRMEAEVDFEAMRSLEDVRGHVESWQKAAEMLETAQMPPKGAKQPSDAQRRQLQTWVRQYLKFEARAQAGDPGPVVLRRLSNAQYTYTVRDLTGLTSLEPAREFPVDGAAGEGFTNAGGALVMSPSLLTKYLDAAKDIASHAVLVPDGIRFSPHSTRRDWTNELLDQIRSFYAEFTDSGGADRVNLQGIVFDTNQGGRLPIEKYITATLVERDALASGSKSMDAVAVERGLNAKYLERLWELLAGDSSKAAGGDGDSARGIERPNVVDYSPLRDALRQKWNSAKPNEAASVAAEIGRWQQALWKFNTVGHIGKVGGPKAWMEPASPIRTRQEVRLKLPSSADGSDVVVYLTASDLGDGNEQDYLVWERPRLVAPGKSDLLLRDVRATATYLAARRGRIIEQAERCLRAAALVQRDESGASPSNLARQLDVDPDALAAWLTLLGISGDGPAHIETHFRTTLDKVAGYEFVQGWGGNETPLLVANRSDQHVRIPGNMKPHSIAIHPSPSRAAVVGWQSPIQGKIKVSASVQHAHPECGNGVTWSLELRRGSTRQRLANGTAQGAKEVSIGPIEDVRVRAGDLISLRIGPRDGNHACDLTAIDLSLSGGEQDWNLAREVSPNVLASNPHSDGFGNPGVWHFYTESDVGESGFVIPGGSLLARWESATNDTDRSDLAAQIQKLLSGEVPSDKNHPDGALFRQLTSLGGPLVSAGVRDRDAAAGNTTLNGRAPWGLDPARFGRHPKDSVEEASLCVRAPSVIEVRLPAEIVEGCELVATAALHADTGREGSVQVRIATSASEPSGFAPELPVIVCDGSDTQKRIQSSFEAFRDVFPVALCYTKIVPVDEVVTLTLFYREDDQLCRLMLDDAQAKRLDRMWSELHFISQDALTLVDAFEQLWQYATQDADPKVFEPMRGPIYERAAAFRKLVGDTEPKHLDALLQFAAQAYRHPLSDAECNELRSLYQRLRDQEIPHDDAVRLTLARILVSPAFLYRAEESAVGAAPTEISDWELASRLSYLLWASQPDEPLRSAAEAGRLRRPEVLAEQIKRMMRDPRVRRLATEFACQWLHVYDFESLDEKSERAFPAFGALRSPMYEETIRFFTGIFQSNGSVLDIVDSDYTYLNEPLAAHYGIPGVSGEDWRRVDGVRGYGRGGVLAQASTLAKQSGASRTSPILRGNWISEVLLGERLPRPPQGVPQLPETAPAGLTERQLIEKHSSDPACVKCHARIDPFGFALEGFDAIGTLRRKDAGDLPIDTRTTLPDGTAVDGLAGLRQYLRDTRREDFVRQFCRKLLGYALGRSVQLSDEPLLDEMQTELRNRDYQIAAAVERIVLSKQFQMIRGRHSAEEQ